MPSERVIDLTGPVHGPVGNPNLWPDSRERPPPPVLLSSVIA